MHLATELIQSILFLICILMAPFLMLLCFCLSNWTSDQPLINVYKYLFWFCKMTFMVYQICYNIVSFYSRSLHTRNKLHSGQRHLADKRRTNHLCLKDPGTQMPGHLCSRRVMAHRCGVCLCPFKGDKQPQPLRGTHQATGHQQVRSQATRLQENRGYGCEVHELDHKGFRNWQLDYLGCLVDDKKCKRLFNS